MRDILKLLKVKHKCEYHHLADIPTNCRLQGALAAKIYHKVFIPILRVQKERLNDQWHFLESKTRVKVFWRTTQVLKCGTKRMVILYQQLTHVEQSNSDLSVVLFLVQLIVLPYNNKDNGGGGLFCTKLIALKIKPSLSVKFKFDCSTWVSCWSNITIRTTF